MRDIPQYLAGVSVDPSKTSENVARRASLAFNDAINRRDLAALRSLMTEDHTFIDSDDNVVSGREDVINAWKEFFDAFGDYRNVWARVTTNHEVLVAIGRSVCAVEPRLDGPAIWTASVRGEKVSVWRVYEDTPENRAMLGLDIEQ